jgi:hypothetical protein
MAQAAEKIAPSWGAKVKSLKAFDRLKDELGELIERFKNRVTLERCSWSEAYAQGRVAAVAEKVSNAGIFISSAYHGPTLWRDCPSDREASHESREPAISAFCSRPAPT